MFLLLLHRPVWLSDHISTHMFQRHITHVCWETFFQPQIIPSLHSHIIAKPLMCGLVRDDRRHLCGVFSRRTTILIFWHQDWWFSANWDHKTKFINRCRADFLNWNKNAGTVFLLCFCTMKTWKYKHLILAWTRTFPSPILVKLESESDIYNHFDRVFVWLNIDWHRCTLVAARFAIKRKRFLLPLNIELDTVVAYFIWSNRRSCLGWKFVFVTGERHNKLAVMVMACKQQLQTQLTKITFYLHVNLLNWRPCHLFLCTDTGQLKTRIYC